MDSRCEELRTMTKSILNDQMRCVPTSDRGSFAIPVFDGDGCIGVLEFVMITNCIDNFLSKMEEVCRALKKAGLQSSDQNKCSNNIKEAGLQLSDQNESINIDTSNDLLTTASRKGKSCGITRDQVTKLFGLSKSCAAKRLKVSNNTFSKVHQNYGIDRWPYKSNSIAKSDAYIALIDGTSPELSPDEARSLEWINSQVMEDDDDVIIFKQDSQMDEYNSGIAHIARIDWTAPETSPDEALLLEWINSQVMKDDDVIMFKQDSQVDDYKSGTANHKRVREHPDTSASPVLLEMYQRETMPDT